MANQLRKFSHRLAEISQPLRELLSTKRSWVWGPDQERAFAEVKAELTQPTVLTFYDPQANTKISADASSFGLGAVLLQLNQDAWRPVAYASRSMSETERRYAQIEKEALAVTWACEKFSDYILGRSFHIESDHKPLIPILSTKQLDKLPPRVLRFRLRLARFNYTIEHVPGKLLYTADALSRAPTADADVNALQSEEEVEVFMDAVVSTLPASAQQLQMYCKSQAEDSECARVQEYCRNGWPEKRFVEPDILPYWKARSSLSMHKDLLLYEHRIVVPVVLRKETLERVHEGHQGIDRCRSRVKQSVWWPGVAGHILQKVEQCSVCVRAGSQRKEPLIPTPLPDYPWQVIGSDLCELKGEHYLVTMDYFSRYPEVINLTTTTSAAVITALKSIFSRYGIPEVVRSDNGPQFASATFAELYGFQLLTSSHRATARQNELSKQ